MSAHAHHTTPLGDDLIARVDALFRDADRHGPRSSQLIRRAALPLAALPLAIAVALMPVVRDALMQLALPVRAADAVLVVPALAMLLAFGGVCAPLSRLATWRVLVPALVLLAGGEWLVARGALVWSTLPLAIGALLLGIAAARTVRRAVWVLPVLLAAGLSDLQSVRSGTTRQLLDHAGTGSTNLHVATHMSASVPADQVAALDAFVLHLPALSSMWLIGLVDIVAIGLLLGLAHLYWLATRRVAAGLLCVLVVAMLLPGGVPVLPLLGVAFVVVNARLVIHSTRFSLRRLLYLGG